MQQTQTSHATLECAGLGRVLARHGLRVRGGWIPAARDQLPALPGGHSAAVVWMVGQVGSECWSAFAASKFLSDGQANPMDRWSKSIGNPLAQQFGGVALYPSDGPPYRPFQQWAERAEPLRTSPLMLQIHPQYGLWHACRFALAMPELLAQDAPAITRVGELASSDPCLSCDGQPCLSACPVQAFTVSGYNVASCAAHLHQPQGQACMQTGCQARWACPVGTGHRYAPAHAAFHMASFAKNH